MDYKFVKGVPVLVKGFRGGSREPKKYNMFLLTASTDKNGYVVAAELKYRGHFWFMRRGGKIARVIWGRNGSHKMYTLCDDASVTLPETFTSNKG